MGTASAPCSEAPQSGPPTSISYGCAWQDADVLVQRAAIYFRMGELGQALHDFDEALNIYSTKPTGGDHERRKQKEAWLSDTHRQVKLPQPSRAGA
jgi:hypothetical protein